jgi:hypothetical protein
MLPSKMKNAPIRSRGVCFRVRRVKITLSWKTTVILALRSKMCNAFMGCYERKILKIHPL